jgi:hypothetical protein
MYWAQPHNMNLTHRLVSLFWVSHDVQYVVINLQPVHRVFWAVHTGCNTKHILISDINQDFLHLNKDESVTHTQDKENWEAGPAVPMVNTNHSLPWILAAQCAFCFHGKKEQTVKSAYALNQLGPQRTPDVEAFSFLTMMHFHDEGIWERSCE